MTAEELIRLPDDSMCHELIKGELLTMPPPGDLHGAVTMNLTGPLFNHVKANNLGVLRAAETGFKLESDPDTVLAPDIAFIARDRVGGPVSGYRNGAPDLVVEVMSQWDTRPKAARKAALWVELGARSVWVVNPRQRTVEIWQADREKRIFHETDELVDDTVPGFRVKVSEIFA
ncbi:MAG TPA: Uma2 family endonuclease [Pyrinomonadaceae bacterium]|jgi:Uma2 family endonuclease|nr:Uma2 family endonuclease [Pyrinomonadaceae bacterium]